MTETTLLSHREIWKQKPVLKRLYTDWYHKISVNLIHGNTLELGGGTGNLKEFAPYVYCTDIVNVPWLDAVIDAQCLPFSDGAFSNIVLFDVLHHIENPMLFFNEACRVLPSGGRIIIMEPYISLLSWPIYHFLHEEDVDFKENPFKISHDDNKKPFDGNQAMARLIFEQKLDEFNNQFPLLKIINKEYLSYFVYPLSGGFEHRSLIPSVLVPPVLFFERLLKPIGKLLAFRIFITLEKA